MRVTAGEFKGRRIPTRLAGRQSPHGALRATSSKVRESVFNILSGKIEGSAFVDLYAGTGAVGIEAMSRGAGQVYFVESDNTRAQAIEGTLDGCGCRGRAKVINKKAVDFINSPPQQGFDIVFLDPPYGSDDLDSILKSIAGCTSLKTGAIVLAEHSSRKTLIEGALGLIKKKTYKYGDTSLTLYINE